MLQVLPRLCGRAPKCNFLPTFRSGSEDPKPAKAAKPCEEIGEPLYIRRMEPEAFRRDERVDSSKS